MAADGAALVFSVASVVEDVLQQHGNRSRDLDLDARRAEEAGMKFSFFFFSPLSLSISLFLWSFQKYFSFNFLSRFCTLSFNLVAVC